MLQYLWLLLPVAAFSGWLACRAHYRRSEERMRHEPVSPFLSSRYIRGLNYLLNEQQDKAIEVFIEMVEVDSETVETHIVLGNLFRRRGEVDRAIRIHQNLIARPTLSSLQRQQALLELGKDYMKAGLLDRAESVFSELIEEGAHLAEPYRLLRDIYEQEKEWSRAIETSQRYQKFSGEDQSRLMAQYHCELGEAALEEGALAAAQDHARKALALDRKGVRSLLLQAACHRARGDHRRALRLLREIPDQRPDFLPEVLPRIIEVYRLLGQEHKLEAWLRELVRRPSAPPSAAVALVDLLIEKGEQAQARRFMEEILAGERYAPALLARYRTLAESEIRGCPAGIASVLRVLGREESGSPHLRCQRCGFEGTQLVWQCPSCHGWDTMRFLDDWITTSPGVPHT